jgi:hypothetical protein
METQASHWKIYDYDVSYSYNAIEADLIRLGATPEEADALTDILWEEGWSLLFPVPRSIVDDAMTSISSKEDPERQGTCGRFSDAYLNDRINWYREFRAPGAEVQ